MQTTVGKTMKKKPVIVVAVLVVAAAIVSVGKRMAPSSHAAAAPIAPSVTVARVLRRDIDDTAVFTGKLQAVNTVELRPRVSGYVEKAPFKEGALVHKGQVLFRVDRRPYKAEVDRISANLVQARAQLRLAFANAERGRRLLRQHALSKEEADGLKTAAATARAQVDSTRAALATARLNLGFTEVRSPIDGRVSRALVTPGNLVTSSSVLTRIVTVKPMYADFQVDERHYLAFERRRHTRDGLPAVDMGLADERTFPHRGHIDFVDNELHSRSGTIHMRAVFPNGKGLYTPGLYVRVRLHSGKRRPRILIDDRAIGSDLNNRFVYVVDAHDKVAYRRVVTGPLYAGLRVVDDGLRPKDRIIVSGLQRVRPGMQVKTSTVAMQANLSPRDRALLEAAAGERPDVTPETKARLAETLTRPAQH